MSLLTILLQAAGGSQQWSGILMMVVILYDPSATKETKRNSKSP